MKLITVVTLIVAGCVGGCCPDNRQYVSYISRQRVELMDKINELNIRLSRLAADSAKCVGVFTLSEEGAIDSLYVRGEWYKKAAQ